MLFIVHCLCLYEITETNDRALEPLDITTYILIVLVVYLTLTNPLRTNPVVRHKIDETGNTFGEIRQKQHFREIKNKLFLKNEGACG